MWYKTPPIRITKLVDEEKYTVRPIKMDRFAGRDENGKSSQCKWPHTQLKWLLSNKQKLKVSNIFPCMVDKILQDVPWLMKGAVHFSKRFIFGNGNMGK
jgi:hypothetical protein